MVMLSILAFCYKLQCWPKGPIKLSDDFQNQDYVSEIQKLLICLFD